MWDQFKKQQPETNLAPPWLISLYFVPIYNKGYLQSAISLLYTGAFSEVWAAFIRLHQ